MAKIKEIWKDVQGFENRYQVSNLGRVKSLSRIVKSRCGTRPVNGRILKLRTEKNGYITVMLSGCRVVKLVHRLVGKAFKPNPENKPCINHLDGDKSNNCDWNLQWVTYSENETHSFGVLGKRNHLFKFSDTKVTAIKLMINEGSRFVDISKKHNVSVGYLYDLKKGRCRISL